LSGTTWENFPGRQLGFTLSDKRAKSLSGLSSQCVVVFASYRRADCIFGLTSQHPACLRINALAVETITAPKASQRYNWFMHHLSVILK
jgi:hypothetical protein